MQKQLFISCPFSSSELFLKQIHPGTDAFFLTAIAGCIASLDTASLEETADFIRREDIRDICIVTDVACPFIDNVLKEHPQPGFEAEKWLQEIYIEHYFTHFRDQSLSVKKNRMARLHAGYQMNAIREAAYIGLLIQQEGIRVKGLVTNRQSSSWKHITDGSVQDIHEQAQFTNSPGA